MQPDNQLSDFVDADRLKKPGYMGYIPQPDELNPPPGLAPKIGITEDQPSLSDFGASKSVMPRSVLGTDVAPGEQISDKQIPKAEKLAADPKAEAKFSAGQDFHNQLRQFGDQKTALDHIMPTNIKDPNFLQDLNSYRAARNAVQENEAKFKMEHPWGTPGNHPGFWGKLGHTLAAVGNAAGEAIAPNVAAAIPGSHLNLEEQAAQGSGGIKEAEGEQAAIQKAEAAVDTGHSHLTEAATNQNVKPRETDIHDRLATVTEDKLPNQAGADIAAGGDVNDPAMQRIIPANAALQKSSAMGNKQQHVAGTDGKGVNAFGDFHPDTGVFTHPDGTPFPDFKPAPNYAQTGNFQPTMVQTPQGQMVPGTLNARTGAVNVPHAGTNVAIPKDVQTEINKELDTARNSDRRLAIMEHNLENALKGDQQAMVSLVANHIGMTLGAQKGARINQAVWEEAVASRPWLQGAQAKFDGRGYLSGVTLSPEQMHQMVGLAKEVRDQQWNQTNQAFSNYGLNINPVGGETESATPTSGGGGRPSVAEWLKSQKKPGNP